ncbi:hypothetical protein [Arthrobacter humicola]
MFEVDGLYWSSTYALNLAANVAVSVRNISLGRLVWCTPGS